MEREIARAKQQYPQRNDARTSSTPTATASRTTPTPLIS